MTIEEVAALWKMARSEDRAREAGLKRAATFAGQLRTWIG